MMYERHATRFKLARVKPAMLTLSLAALLFICACTDRRSHNEVAENSQPGQPTPVGQSAAQPAQVPSPAASAEPTPAPTRVPPQAAEVADKVTRIFRGAVQPDTTRNDGALVGDFNNDGSEDIAIVVKPDPAKLGDINSDVSIWILNDPQKVAPPDPKGGIQTLQHEEPVKVAANDVLLAVIHGYQKDGWRNPAAQQTYLLKNAVGGDMRAIPWQEAFGALKAGAPTQRGDVMREDFNRTPGFIYWTGSKYAWHAATKH